MSTFSGLNTATSALFAQQRALDITGQNIANVNTDGYSRQRVQLQSVGGSVVPATYAVGDGIGQGVDSGTVIRIRDDFMESRAQVEQATTAGLAVKQDALSRVEDAFHEPGEQGLQNQLADMWSSWSDLANNTTKTDGTGARAEVLESTQTVVASMHTVSATLDQQWMQSRDNVATVVDDVNAAASTIADYNQAIKRATSAGLPSNELADRRDALVLKIAAQIGATSSPGEDGAVTVSVGGTTLVSGNSALTLKLAGTTDPAAVQLPPAVTADPLRIVTVPGGTTLRVGGTAAGQIDVMSSTIPQYRKALDGIAQQLATQLNAAHTTSAFDLHGNAGQPVLDDGTGTGADPVDPSTITAANLRLRITDPDKLAASSLGPTGTTASADNLKAMSIAKLGLAADSPDTTYRKLIVGLGVQASVATSSLAAQTVISDQVDGARQSVSGVSIDEEMTNMLQFQHAYSAAAKVITTIDETIQTLLNMVGN